MLNNEVCIVPTDKHTNKQMNKQTNNHTYILCKNRGNLLLPSNFLFSIFVSLMHLKEKRQFQTMRFRSEEPHEFCIHLC